MTRLSWDKTGERTYEAGVDRGVLYLSDGSGVVWNGLTSVEEDESDVGISSFYADGTKYLDSRASHDYVASIKAFTYPDEFAAYDGFSSISPGFILGNQPVRDTFGLSYRTKVGNDIFGLDLGYKLHVLYNLTAKPDNQAYSTQTTDPSVIEFGWTITGVPVLIDGFRPTAHVIFDSRFIDPYKFASLEELFYGSDSGDANQMPLPDLITWMQGHDIITVIDNGDGTWSVTGPDNLVSMTSSTYFQIDDIDALYTTDTTYEIPTTP